MTTLRAGDTEPSWSLAFWDWFQAPSKLLQKEGHIWEMSHRQVGTVVGFLAIALAVALWRREPRPWVKKLGGLMLAGVAVQGVLGGVRVLVVSREGDTVRSALNVSGDDMAAQSLRYLFAMLHAGFAYLLFALMVCLVWLTSRHWREEGIRVDADSGQAIRGWGVGLWGLVFAQLLLGAWLRHAAMPEMGKLVLHASGALLVGLVSALMAVKVFSHRRQLGVLTGTALFVLLSVQVQIYLGILAFLLGGRRIGGLLETGHQVVGPLLFAGSSLLVLRAFRNLELSTEAL